MSIRLLILALVLGAVIASSCNTAVDGKDGGAVAIVDSSPIIPGHDIKVKINGYDQNYLTLGYYYGDKQYVQDTAQIGADGYFNFKDEESLKEGVYMMIMAPDNNFMQVVIDKREQRFTLETSKDSLINHMKITDGAGNQAYFAYLKFLNKQIKKRQGLNDELLAVEEDSVAQLPIRDKMQDLNKEVQATQKSLADKYPGTMLGRLMSSEVSTPTPEFKDDDKGLKAFYFNRAHYFDNIDVSDEGLLRSPVLANKVKAYMTKMVVQHPDSIITAVDNILKGSLATDNFQYFLIDNLNKYASSKVVGMDAVYVHLVKNYYEKGLASWTEPEELEKIIDNGNTLEPILIGKTAPNLNLVTEDNKPISIHGMDSEYTVLLFWDPECSHCEKAMPDMVKFYNDYKNKDVEILAICTVIGQDADMGSCAEKIKTHKMKGWVNASDQYHRSRFKTIYDIKSTPRIFILDKDKEIIMKSIGAEQISDVMKQIMEDDKKVG